jgi:hypothetical protein
MESLDAQGKCTANLGQDKREKGKRERGHELYTVRGIPKWEGV